MESGIVTKVSVQDGMMIASQSFAALNVITSDTLAITWKVQFT